ncbi:hypothetical protein [Desulfonema ishimotonii]|uniref:hypothetical protein n=1 Tax=Desulfonema ishimotonii TaxID=45657 RepID=UPI000F581ECC|nr:hypothetical protein [Desulfonema ishimotonii]
MRRPDRRCWPVLYLLIYLLFLPSVSYAAETFRLLTGYTPSDRPAYSRMWDVFLEISSSDHMLEILFYPEKNPRNSICKIRKSVSDDGRKIFLETAAKKNLQSANGLLVLPEFPAPCSILPIHQIENQKVYEQSRQAGGRTFAKQFSVSRELFKRDVCLKNGWIKNGITTTGMLVMFTVKNKQNKMVIKQLWPENGKWWIYEETVDRRSWRLP